ncbi:MAG: hypothetical protein AAF664_07585 [Planctomycetota bacterium]
MPTSRYLRSNAYMMAVWVLWCVWATPARVNGQSKDFLESLAECTEMIVDGRTLRQGLRRVSEPSKINLWIDRQIDPTQPVSLGLMKGSRLELMKRIANQHDAVLGYTDNIVLVGRPVWVDGMTAATSKLELHRTSRSSIKWPKLTTPNEALKITLRQAQAKSDSKDLQELPHDLWPEYSFTSVNPRAVERLIRGQFAALATLEKLAESSIPTTIPLDNQPAFLELCKRELSRQWKPDAPFVGPPAIRRQILQLMIVHFQSETPCNQVTDINAKLAKLYSFETRGRPFEGLMRFLAKTIDFEVAFDESIESKLQTPVVLAVKDQPLKAIFEELAGQIDGQVEFQDEKVLVSAAKLE